MEDINGKHVKPYTPNLKNGLELSRRVANTFWDLLEARSNAELIDINAWSKEMDQKNCGWKEYALKESLIESTLMKGKFDDNILFAKERDDAAKEEFMKRQQHQQSQQKPK